MGKKCLVCDAPATYAIKDTSDFYCEECAEEQFGDVSLLVKINQEQASKSSQDDEPEDEEVAEDEEEHKEVEQDTEE